ncbi:HNH endonuclease [Candidatus Poriferisocius sp.]|uniref:HNH endonuclease n=1 Tax=Candidatus Poriferisocius sp. TaxID=3101276 RepID=UPI003B01074B
MAFDAAWDERVRSAAFAKLRLLSDASGGVVTWSDIEDGFSFEGSRILFKNRQRGIYKPKVLDAALSITTTYRADSASLPYDDHSGADGYMRYKWEKTDPLLWTNQALRVALEEGVPLIWFVGIAVGLYKPIFPVFLVDEEPGLHQFVVALDEAQQERWSGADAADIPLLREYAEDVAKRRLHQPLFRARVLTAYGSQCGICSLRYPELLDAAHIRADSEGGKPVVTNGISMCKIHHAAYDSHLLGINSDYQVKIRPDVLDDSDGPTLRHAIQGLHDSPLHVPRRRAAKPDRDLLAERFEVFLRAS